MLERNQSFDLKSNNNNDIQKILEHVLEKKLSLSTNTTKLGNSLLRINYFNKKLTKHSQTDNRITILQEPEKRVYIQINGDLNDVQIRQLWGELEESLNNSENPMKNGEKLHSRNEIIEVIRNLIENGGYAVKKDEIVTFIDNFIEEYGRLPKNNEFDSIVKGYIIMIHDEEISSVKHFPHHKKNSEVLIPILENDQKNILINSYENRILSIEEKNGRRKCPNCGNKGLIHEVDDKTTIILDYPKIYGKKKRCAECGIEWKKDIGQNEHLKLTH